jgi:hypothetical protein
MIIYFLFKEMEVAISNYSGQPLIILTSDQYITKQYIKDVLPVKGLLGSITNKSWLKTIKSNPDDINKLISVVKNALSPQLQYQDFVLAGDSTFISNIFKPPNYLYCIGFIASGTKLALTFSIFKLANMIDTSSEDLLNSVQIYIGANNTFYCDAVTPDGENVCQQPLSDTTKFINGKFTEKLPGSHAPTAEFNSEIQSSGLNGNSYVIQLFITTDAGVVPDDETLTQTVTNIIDWSSIITVGLFLLVVTIAIVAVIMLLSRNGSFSVVNNTSEASTIPNINI